MTYAQELAEKAEELQDKGQQERAEELLHIATLAGYKEEAEQCSQERTTGLHGGQILSEVEEEEIPWLWQDWIPLGLVTLFVGPAEGGKSTFWRDLAARITRDAPMPDGTLGLPGGVVIISPEEGTASVVVPRLRKAGADLSKIIDLSFVDCKPESPGEPTRRRFALDLDLPRLEAAIRQVNAVLVIIDPLMSGISENKSAARNQTARALITTCQEMAERLGIAVLIVNHFVKGGEKNPLEKMAGSKGFSDIVRSAMMLSLSPSNPGQRTLTLIKHNLVADGTPPLVFEWKKDGSGTIEYVRGLTHEQAEMHEQVVIARTKDGVLKLLQAQPQKAFTPSEIAQTLSVPATTIRKELRRMTDDGLIVQTDRGFYRAKPVPQVVLVDPKEPLPEEKK